MADTSSIEWTSATWNPVVGCKAVSPGCDHCYAARKSATRLKHRPEYSGLTNPDGTFNGVVRCLPERLRKPLTWRAPRRIFVNSMSDLFHDQVPDEFIAKVFAVMALAPQHAFQVLTKRHARMRSLLSSPMFRRRMYDALVTLDYQWINDNRLPWPLPNVWLGVSVENQQWEMRRGRALRETPAAVRFYSAEPLLGQITANLDGIDWVIVGGESGGGARPMHPQWARDIRDQCIAAGVPFFFKQWGEWRSNGYGVRVGLGETTTWLNNDFRPAELWVPGAAPDEPRLTHTVYKRIGKKAAGRLLDGRTWDEYPAGVA